MAAWPAADSAESLSEKEIGANSLGLMEAVEMTLQQDPNIAFLESQLASSRGALLSARGLFDPLLSTNLFQSDLETPSSDGSSSESSALSSTIQVTQLLRSGLSIEPGLELTSTDTDRTINQATVSFTLRQPLLRDRSSKVGAASERAA